MLDGLLCHHAAHIASAGRIADHSRSAAKQCDRLISRHLKTFHQAESHKVSYMQRICCGVKADVKGCFSVIDQFLNFFLICKLSQKASCF